MKLPSPTGLAFSKWEGLGNDFVILEVDLPDQAICASWARELCHRHTGIGADGLVFLLPGPRMVIYNSDGSPASMCGNALRCLGAVAVQRGTLSLNQGSPFQTASGERGVRVTRQNPWWVEVDMGVPVLGEVATFSFEGRDLTAHLASMGNPHAVIVNSALPGERWFDGGKMLQKAPFAEVDGINVEFLTTRPCMSELDLWVYERGVGPTLACGTGACAAFAVARKLGLVAAKGKVNLPGGYLEIEKDERGGLKMGGPAREVFRGNWTA